MKKFTDKTRIRHVLTSWIISYILVAVLPLLIGVLLYAVIVGTLTEEAGRVNDASVRQMRQAVDNELREAARISSQLTLDQDVQALLYRKVEGPSQVLRVLDIQEQLQMYLTSNSLVEEIYLYFPKNNTLVSSDNKVNGADIRTELSAISGMTAEVSDAFLSLDKLSGVRILGDEGGNGTSQRIACLYSLYLNDFGSPAGTLMILYNRTRFLEILDNLDWSRQGGIFLVDPQHHVLALEPLKELPDWLLYEGLNNAPRERDEMLGTLPVKVTVQPSAVTELVYVSAMPTRIFLSRVRNILNFIYLYVALCLVLGIAGSLFFARRNFTPVRRITRMLSGKTDDMPLDENEFRYVENSVHRLIRENTAYQSRIRRQQQAARNNALVRLLKGRFMEQEYRERLSEEYGLQLDTPLFACVAFQIEDYNHTVYSGEDGEDPEDLIRFIVTNIFEELIREDHQGWMADVDGRLVCLVGLATEAVETLEELAERTLDLVAQPFEIVLSAAVSNVHPRVQGFAPAYAQILELFEYKRITEDPERMLSYRKRLVSQAGMDESYNLANERFFINAILASDFQRAEEVLETIIETELAPGGRSVQLLRSRMYGLVNSMLNAIGEIRTDLGTEFLEQLDPMRRMLGAETLGEIQTAIRSLFAEIRAFLQQSGNRQESEWLATVEQMVHDHFRETDLSIGGLALRLGISVSHLSRTFKKLKGAGLLDYIHQVRLAEAKALMNTSKSIREIAGEVGYVDSKALIRAFKRYEGITPGRFREADTGD